MVPNVSRLSDSVVVGGGNPKQVGNSLAGDKKGGSRETGTESMMVAVPNVSRLSDVVVVDGGDVK